MKSKPRFALWALAFSLIPLFAASIARAQAPRTYVSADKGNDAKKCTSDQPCRTFTKALTEVAAGGEVVALDSGDYEPFTITKSVTVQAAPGVNAGIPA